MVTNVLMDDLTRLVENVINIFGRKYCLLMVLPSILFDTFCLMASLLKTDIDN